MRSLAAQRRQVERCERRWQQRSQEFVVRRKASLARVTGWVRMAPWALGSAWLVHRLSRSADDESSQSGLARSERPDQASAGGAEASSRPASQVDQLNDWLNLLGNAVQIYMVCSDAFAAKPDRPASAQPNDAEQPPESTPPDEAMSGDFHAAQ